MAHPPLRLISADQLKELPPTERLGLTKFVARGLNIVYGPSGCYKSFYALDASLRIAQTQPIIYVAGEGVGGLHRRVEAWCEHNKLTAGHAYFIDQAIDIRNSTSVDRFCRLADAVNPALIIFDTLARCIPGADENSARDMGLAVHGNDTIRQRLDTTCVWIHHANRAERGERGSGAVRGAADNMIEIFPNGDGSIRVTCSKSKDEEHWMDEQLSFLPVLQSGVLVPTTGYASLQYSELELRILEFLALETFRDYGARAIQLVNALNIPERTLYRLLSHLKTDCQIDQGKRGDPYRLTDIGRNTIHQRSATPTDTIELPFEQ